MNNRAASSIARFLAPTLVTMVAWPTGSIAQSEAQTEGEKPRPPSTESTPPERSPESGDDEEGSSRSRTKNDDSEPSTGNDTPTTAADDETTGSDSPDQSSGGAESESTEAPTTDEPSEPEQTPPEQDQNESDEEGGVEAQLRAIEEEVESKSNTSNDRDDEPEDEASIDAQVDSIEREVGTSSNRNRSSASNALNPDLSVILDTGFAWQSDDRNLVGGPDPKRFGFFLQSVELALQADVDPFFTFDSHLITTLDGVKVGEAYGTTLSLPADLQARFGKFKTQFGRVNPVHLHAWHFTALPLVNGKMLGPAGLNGLGVEFSQLLPVPWYAQWVVAVQDLSSPATGNAFLRDPKTVESPLDFVATGRLEQFFDLTPDWSLLVGLNAALGRNDSGGTDRRDEFFTEIYGLDLFGKWKSTDRQEIGWQSEAMLRHRRTPEGLLRDIGGYSYLYWAPVPRWELGGRYGAVSGPLEADNDYLHPTWLDTRQRAGPALSYYPSEFSRFRLEYMANDLGSGFDDPEHVVLLQVQLVTGAHGAHKF